MTEQRFWWWESRGGVFTVFNYPDDDPPYVVLECVPCGWRFLYPELEPSKEFWAGDSEEHERACKYRMAASA